MSVPSTRERALRRASLGPRGRGAVIGILFLAYAAWLSWPMPVHPSSDLWGPGGDVLGVITQFRELAQHAVPFLAGRIPSLGAPEGMPVDYPFYVATWPSTGFLYLLSLTVGSVAAMNILILSGFTVTALAVWALVRYCGGGDWAGAIAGWALAFQPGQLFNAVSAPDFLHLWIVVFMVWRLFVLRESPSRRNGLIAGGASVIAVSWNPYFLLIGTVAFAALASANVVVAARRREFAGQVRGLAWSVVPLAVAGIVYAAVTVTATQSGIRTRSAADIYLYSARPAEYLDPPSIDRLLGWLQVPGTRTGVQTNLYVGLTIVALALVAVVVAIRGRSRFPRRADVFSLLWLGAVALVWSGPPTAAVGGLTLKLPAYFVSQLTTTWRIYGRFGLIVSFVAVVLAGLGLSWLLAAMRPRWRIAAVPIVAALVVFDLTGLRFPAAPLARPPIYDALQAQPAGAVAEYPLLPSVLAPYDQLYRQDYHHRRLLNGYDPGSPAEARALTLTALDDATVSRLSRLGIRYVLLDTARAPAPGLPPPGRPSTRLKLLATSGTWRLLEVPDGPPTPFSE